MRHRLRSLVFVDYAVDARALAVFRIVYASAAILLLGPQVATAGRLPASFFAPPLGPARLVSELPSPVALQAIELLVVGALAAVLVGWHTRAASWIAALTWMGGEAIAFSFGKVDHHLLFILIPPLLATAGWGEALSLDRRRRPARPVEAWPIALFAWLLALMMLGAALPKLRTGWLDPSFQAIQSVMLRQYHVHGRDQLLAPWTATINSRAVWEVIDVAIVVLEASFVLAVLSPRLMRLACALAICFHFGVVLTANIPFTGNVVAYGVFFLPLLPLDRLSAGRETLRAPWSIPIAVAAAALLASYPTIGPPGLALVVALGDETGLLVSTAVLGAAFLAALAYLAGAVRRWRRAPAQERPAVDDDLS